LEQFNQDVDVVLAGTQEELNPLQTEVAAENFSDTEM